MRYKIYENVYRRLPAFYRKWIETHLNYSGFSTSPYVYSGFSITYGIAIALVVFLLCIVDIFPKDLSHVLPVVSFISFQILTHGILIIASESRKNFVEEILPDTLRLLASNIRSGLTMDRALLLSARPEFGPLAVEMRKASKEIIAGKPIDKALARLTLNINSRLLRRTIDLLTEGLRRGGNLPSLLDNLAEDIRQAKVLKKEISAVVMMYVIFIFFAVAIGSPLLFSISTFLIQTITTISGKVEVPTVATSRLPFITFKVAAIDIQFLNFYSLTAIGIISIFGGLMIGLVQEGTEKAGLKYVPILLLLSYFVYFIIRSVISNLFSGLILG